MKLSQPTRSPATRLIEAYPDIIIKAPGLKFPASQQAGPLPIDLPKISTSSSLRLAIF